MATILVGKFGVVLKFNPKYKDDLTFTASLGAEDAVKFIVNIAYNNPADTFIVVGRNDLDSLTEEQLEALFPRKNVINAWPKGCTDDFTWPVEYIRSNGMHPTHGIFFLGIGARYSVPGGRNLAGDLVRPLQFAIRSCAPIIYALNTFNVPWVALCDDPRSLEPSYDLVNQPQIVLSQFNGEFVGKHYAATDDYTLVDFKRPIEYAGVEYCCTYDEIFADLDALAANKTRELGIALNKGAEQGAGSSKIQERWPLLKAWVLDIDTDHRAAVYGSWPDEIVAKDKRFIGAVSRTEIQRIMREWRTSICIPIAEGWATSKYLEYLKNGVAPFFHPGYDDQQNTSIQDFFRVATPQEFSDKLHHAKNDTLIELELAHQRCLNKFHTSGASLGHTVYTALDLPPVHHTNWHSRDLWTVQPRKTDLSEFFS